MAERLLKESFLIRPYEPGDEVNIVRVFRESFRTPYDLDVWRWKYQESPWARPELSIVVTLPDGEMIGHCGAVPHPINLVGRQWMGVESTDLMVASRYRGQGVIPPMLRAAIESIEKAGIQVILAYPNEYSLGPVHLFCRHTAIMEKYHLPLGSPFHTNLRGRVNSVPEESRFQFHFNHDYKLDERYDRLWSRCCKRESLSVWKHRNYMAWRYCSGPSRYRLFSLELGGEIVAICVCQEKRKAALVFDLLSVEKNTSIAREILLDVADYYLGRNFEELRFVGSDPWFFSEVFSEFERRPSFSRQFFVRACNREEAFLYENSLNWTATLGDSDFLWP